jgi:monothiol glutaredoxin
MPATALPDALRTKLEALVRSDDVVLFMKGNRSFPQCGFSARVVGILNTMLPNYTTFNVLSDAEVREGMKQFSDWPTFPQLYVRGELVGGADIISAMADSGELATALGVSATPAAPPALTVTARAAAELRAASGDGGPGDVIHLTIDERWEHALDLGPPEAGHVSVTSEGVTVQLDPVSAARAAGVVIDFVEGPQGAGFKIDNPNRPKAVRQVGPKELKALLDAGRLTHLYDVRTPQERATASIAAATLLDPATMERLEALPRSTPIAFHCHHGGRSLNAANHFLSKGFTEVYNLAGGIDAWSKDIDPSVPRY